MKMVTGTLRGKSEVLGEGQEESVASEKVAFSQRPWGNCWREENEIAAAERRTVGSVEGLFGAGSHEFTGKPSLQWCGWLTPATFSSVGVDLEKAYLYKGSSILGVLLESKSMRNNKGVESTSKGGLIIII